MKKIVLLDNFHESKHSYFWRVNSEILQQEDIN